MGVRAPILAPAAWTVPELGAKDALSVDLEPRHLEALERALAAARAAGRGEQDLSLADFPLEAIGADLADWRKRIRAGRGLVVLRGFPVADMDIASVGLMFLGLGLHFGIPVSQSNRGERLGHVVDVGGKDTRERAYRTSRELKLHTDRCDHVAMLCIRPAWRGGRSGYASAPTIHNLMLAERPDLLEHLFNGFHMHRFGQQAPGEPPITPVRVPVFSQCRGAFNVVYLRAYYELAHREGLATLSDGEREALDYFDEVANRDEVRLDFDLEPGDVTLINNCVLLHTRTAFEDAPGGRPGRHLLRLWLMEEGRPALEAVTAHKGMQGIGRLEGRGTYYRGASA